MEKNTSEPSIKNILVPLDGSDNSFSALEYALKLAKSLGSSVTVLHTIQSPGSTYSTLIASTFKDMLKESKKEANKWFRRARKMAKEYDLEIKTKFVDTMLSVPSAIVRYAENNGHDLIVIGSTGKSGLERVVLGSVSSSVVTHSPCPVTVVR